MTILFDRIEQQYSTMSKSQQHIANYLRQHPQQFVDSSTHELEQHVGVSASTIVRFVQSLGYAGMDEMRVYLVQQIQHNEQSIDLVIKPEDDAQTLTMKMQQLYRDAAETLHETLDNGELTKAISTLRQAKRIYLFGVGTSGLVAYDLYHRLNRYGKTSFYDTDAHMNLEFSTQSTADDVILAISYSGITKEVVVGAQAAQKRNTPVISIVSNLDSPLTKQTDITLQIPQTEHLVRLASISSRIHSMIVTDILFSGIIQKQLPEM
ncbi:MurR/RpiR family transcriptional regulator [Loigolactobacillus jiayinensis]|uniref:MurR/RpiR family transcriptional regulator n=1 Tax=Loigolactobacillus jiayinensis TaxID=2486016 RepID=A0ABW1RDL6_9LACO|nr:MurR/RpiR family transcriptional regulator [Loigolactobacillus jiayinensis]